jgi:2-polyprenyl-6-methoxyphenol hydroxylase-like FAD-dependent oxidoreductase
VRVTTTNGDERARLVIDCSGGISPIASTFKLHAIRGFFTVYGAHVEDVELATPDLVLANVARLGCPMHFVEVIPTSARSALFVLFTATQQAQYFDDLRSSFDAHLAANPFIRTNSETRTTAIRKGVIPIARMRRRSLPRVVSFGEAALMQPPLLGSAFNEVLQHAASVAMQIRSAFDRCDVESLRIAYPAEKHLNDALQWRLVDSMIDQSVERFDYLVRLVSAIKADALFRLYSNELTLSESMRVALNLGIAALREPRRVVA